MGLTVKFVVSFNLFSNALKSLGTENHKEFIEKNLTGEIVGAFALTEVGHGSNVRGMKTTATYDPEAKEFIINTPNFEAAKAWIGGLGKTSTHAVVYAKLITPDGQNHGLNGFFVPIRDTKTLLSLPGILVGDLGEKIGLNGLDNGFAIFNNVRIPRENLLSKVANVTADGKYEMKFKDTREQMGASLGALSAGRVGICGRVNSVMIKAVTTAVRYSAVRKQFGPEDSAEEFPVLEYQAQQFRVLLHLATTYAIQIFSHWLAKVYGEMNLMSERGEDISIIGMEVHAISSAGKAISTWAGFSACQNCREACGGHGYLKGITICLKRN